MWKIDGVMVLIEFLWYMFSVNLAKTRCGHIWRVKILKSCKEALLETIWHQLSIIWITNLKTELWPFWVFCYMSLLIFCKHTVGPSSKIEIWNFPQRLNSRVPKSWSLMFWKQRSYVPFMVTCVWCAWLYSLRVLIFLAVYVLITTNIFHNCYLNHCI